MTNAICKLNHRYHPKFDTLQEDQSNPPRHKCCGCAYEQGLLDGHNNRPINPDIDAWPRSQAGAVRHKDALEAYYLGHAKGLAII